MNTTKDQPEPRPFLYATRVQRAASALGFDWQDIGGVVDKVDEELDELREALAAHDTAHAQTELGDLFFAAVSVARFLDVDPEQCLAAATNRFEERLAVVMRIAGEQGVLLQSCTPEALDALWEQAKKLMRQQLENNLDK